MKIDFSNQSSINPGDITYAEISKRKIFDRKDCKTLFTNDGTCALIAVIRL